MQTSAPLARPHTPRAGGRAGQQLVRKRDHGASEWSLLLKQHRLSVAVASEGNTAFHFGRSVKPAGSRHSGGRKAWCSYQESPQARADVSPLPCHPLFSGAFKTTSELPLLLPRLFPALLSEQVRVQASGERGRQGKRPLGWLATFLTGALTCHPSFPAVSSQNSVPQHWLFWMRCRRTTTSAIVAITVFVFF